MKTMTGQTGVNEDIKVYFRIDGTIRKLLLLTVIGYWCYLSLGADLESTRQGVSLIGLTMLVSCLVSLIVRDQFRDPIFRLIFFAWGVMSLVALIELLPFERATEKRVQFFIYLIAFAPALKLSFSIYRYIESGRNRQGFMSDIFIVTAAFLIPAMIAFQSVSQEDPSGHFNTVLVLLQLGMSFLVAYMAILSTLLYPRESMNVILLYGAGLCFSAHHFLTIWADASGQSGGQIEQISWLSLGLSVIFCSWFVFVGRQRVKVIASVDYTTTLPMLSLFATVLPISMPLQLLVYERHLAAYEADNGIVAVLSAIAIGLVGVKTWLYQRVEHQHKQRLTTLTEEDVLTGAYNRRGILERIQQTIDRADNKTLAVAVLDVDRFKAINDRCGHTLGDQLLKDIAQRLKSNLPQAVVGRLGGDEFLMLLDAVDQESLKHLVAIAFHSTCFQMQTDDASVDVTTSIGGVLVHQPYDIKHCLKLADKAMYQAKRSGCGYFIESAESALPEEALIDEAIVSGLEQDGLKLEIQPIYSVQSGQLIGGEVLWRLESASGKTLMPKDFMPVLQMKGGMIILTERLLGQLAVLQRNIDHLLTINIPPSILIDRQSFSRLLGAIDYHQINPEKTILEITDDGIASVERLVDSVTRLHRRGFRIALDDFSVGDSSLARVAALPVSYLKISSEFLLDVGFREQTVMQSAISLSRRLDAKILIDDVESEMQLRQVTQMGADFVQGYALCEPLSFERFTQLPDIDPRLCSKLQKLQANFD
ncbi:MAG: EAL domain-containing protein [Gammaproteobacteria bacterium]|nr:EAL domain-containing protein [Gammaproteobacteria bacterium]